MTSPVILVNINTYCGNRQEEAEAPVCPEPSHMRGESIISSEAEQGAMRGLYR